MVTKFRSITIAMLILSLTFLNGCADSSSYDSAYSDGYDEGYNQGQIDLEDEIQYYESICDELGYLTYDMVYNPEMWRYYICHDTGLYHEDYLCPEITNISYATVNANLDLENCTACAVCCPADDIYYLDEEAGIIHHDKNCLILGTEENMSPLKNYKFVSKKRALEKGYTHCPKCCKSNAEAN